MNPTRRSGPSSATEAAPETPKVPARVVPPSVAPVVAPHVSADPDPWWLDGALRALHVLAETGRPFTVDQLREPPYALPDPHHPNAWGGLVQAGVRGGWLQRVGYVASPAASRHGGVVSLWRGTRRVRGDDG